MTPVGRWFAAGSVFLVVTVVAGDAGAAQAPKKGKEKEKPKHQQLIPTGEEDAPAPASASPTRGPVARETDEALMDRITSKDSTGLVPETLNDGSIRVNLQDRFQHVLRVTQDKDGALAATCRDGHVGAATKPDPSKKADVGKAPPVTPPAVLEEK